MVLSDCDSISVLVCASDALPSRGLAKTKDLSLYPQLLHLFLRNSRILYYLVCDHIVRADLRKVKQHLYRYSYR